jgi:hypothetical protein
MGISRHPGLVDVAALHPLPHAGQATLAAARITAKIGAALFGAGYASDTNFTTACDPELYVAVTNKPPDRPAHRRQNAQHRKHLLAEDGRQARSFRPVTGSRCRAARFRPF